jgi:hypothetical protein
MTDEKGFEGITQMAARFEHKMIDELGLEDAFLVIAMMKVATEVRCLHGGIFDKKTILNGILNEKKLIEELELKNERVSGHN